MTDERQHRMGCVPIVTNRGGSIPSTPNRRAVIGNDWYGYGAEG